MKFVLTTLILLMTVPSFAKEFTYYARSPQALLMGDAFTAIADDEYTLYYNPAALGRHSGFTLYLANPNVSATNPLGDLDRFSDLPEDAVGIAGRFLGYPVHLGLGITPGLKMGNFGLSLFAQNHLNFKIMNITRPMLDIDYRYDRGFATGFAFTSGKMGKKGTGRQFNFGVGLKYVKREALINNFALFSTKLLNIINQTETSDTTALRDALGYSKGRSWALDLASEMVIRPSSNSQFVAAIAAMDFGGTHFTEYQGAQVQPQEMMLNTGIAWSQDWGLLDYQLSMDYVGITQPADAGTKIKMGGKLGLPLLDVMLGYNGGYLSYGVGVEFWPLRLYAGFYGVELGAKYKQFVGNRALIYLSLLDMEFDM